MSCTGAVRVQPGGGIPATGYPQRDSLATSEAPGISPVESMEYDPAVEIPDPSSYIGGGGQSFVIIDLSQPKDLRGYLRCGKWLADLMGKYTGLTIDENMKTDLMNLPIIGGTGAADHATRQRIVDYLTHGGFALGGVDLDMEHALRQNNIDFHWEVLAADHPIFHCYFDLVAEPLFKHGAFGPESFRTRGFFIGNRLVSVVDMPGGEKGTVNAVVFALIQPGGIARRYVQP